ncbi:MAG: hypothetical protein ABWK02_02310 [Aquificaceae bacterium]|nr:hypothetical protein [Aquificaceae bacterium]
MGYPCHPEACKDGAEYDHFCKDKPDYTLEAQPFIMTLGEVLVSPSRNAENEECKPYSTA